MSVTSSLLFTHLINTLISFICKQVVCLHGFTEGQISASNTSGNQHDISCGFP